MSILLANHGQIALAGNQKYGEPPDPRLTPKLSSRATRGRRKEFGANKRAAKAPSTSSSKATKASPCDGTPAHSKRTSILE